MTRSRTGAQQNCMAAPLHSNGMEIELCSPLGLGMPTAAGTWWERGASLPTGSFSLTHDPFLDGNTEFGSHSGSVL